MKNQGLFIDDISVPDMAYAFTVRSPCARGELRELLCPELPENYYFITAKDIPGINSLADFPLPVLGEKKIEYIGQPLAILAGPDEDTLEDINSEIFIDIEEENPLFSLDDHTEEDILIRRDINFGDSSGPESKVITGTYTSGCQEHWYCEPCGALVFHEEEGLRVYTASQWPFHVMRSLAGLLGWEENRIRVETTPLAMHLDGKIWYPSLLACHAALAAQISGKAVKLILARAEDFVYSPKRNMSEIKIRSLIGDKNEIKHSEIELKLNLGVQGVFENEIIDQSCLGAQGLYNQNSLILRGLGIRTNIPVQGPLAGFGLSQGFFAAERQASRIADLLGIDPAQWRKDNFKGQNQGKSKILPGELIDKAAAMSDYYRKWASYELLRKRRREEKWNIQREPLRGIGITTAFQGNGFLHNKLSGNDRGAMELTLEKDGSLKIKSSLARTDSGSFEACQIIAREILGVDPELIEIVNDTEDAPDSGAGTLSRGLTVLTDLVEKGCDAIRSQRFRDPLPITVNSSREEAKSSQAFKNPGWAAAVTEIEIDPDSYIPSIRGIWLVVEAGKILSRRKARYCLETGIIHALGWTCREQIHYVEGQIPLELFRSYDIPHPSEFPPIHIDFIQNDGDPPKGIGELPFSCIPASYVQAVSQAMDHPFEKIPMDARDIWEAGQQKQGGSIH